MTQPCNSPATTKNKKICLNNNGLSIECFINNNGKIYKRIERFKNNSIEFTYQFDDNGHLCKTLRNGTIIEKYQYNQQGQRVEHYRSENRFIQYTTNDLFSYNAQGQLVQAGNTSFSYDKNGALSERCDHLGIFKFVYGDDTMLDTVKLSSGKTIRYEYGKENPLGPAKRFRNNMLITEYIWENPLQLSGYIDYELQLKYTFTYTKENTLDTIHLRKLPKNSYVFEDKLDWLEIYVTEKKIERLQQFFPTPTTILELFCCTDQVGTVKIVQDKHGAIAKELAYDSFGVLLYDSLPDLFVPIGFAGGLLDNDTELVRFGWRDYDPTVGRFTAPDPLGDTGGDHDLYDYCIDDPVTMNDPTGLIAPILAAGLTKLGALAIGATGTYFAATAADKLKEASTGIESTTARDTIKKATPEMLDAWSYSLYPGRTLGKIAFQAPKILIDFAYKRDIDLKAKLLKRDK